MIKKKNYIGELVLYIKKNIKKGYTKESLKWALINQGHSRIEVEKALTIADEELANTAPILHTKPDINYELVEPKIEDKKPWWKRMFGS